MCPRRQFPFPVWYQRLRPDRNRDTLSVVAGKYDRETCVTV